MMLTSSEPRNYEGWLGLEARMIHEEHEEEPIYRIVQIRAHSAPVVEAYELAVECEKNLGLQAELRTWPAAGVDDDSRGPVARVELLLRHPDRLCALGTAETYLAWVCGYLTGRAHEDTR